MLNALFSEDVLRVLKNLDEPPEKRVLRKLAESCLLVLLLGQEAMWEEFNKIWTDRKITKSVIDALDITPDFCSWLLHLQQTVPKDMYNIILMIL